MNSIPKTPWKANRRMPGCRLSGATKKQEISAIAVIGSILIAIILIVLSSCAQASEWHDYTNDQIANAIYKAENSKKYPYGVKSINTHGDEAYARKICLNSIKNARKRCEGHDLIVCMGKRYSPPDINPNWVRLVKYFIKH